MRDVVLVLTVLGIFALLTLLVRACTALVTTDGASGSGTDPAGPGSDAGETVR